MCKVNNIKAYKNELRKTYKSKRAAMTAEEKDFADKAVFERVVKLKGYAECRAVLTYVSTEIEVDTYRLIEYSLSNGKIVAVPRCVPGTRNMEFYRIGSLDELERGSFSVYEPRPDLCERLCDFSESVCIVPGLCFDGDGYRLGYGKGYYDRFLSDYDGQTIGLCYTDCLRKKLVPGRYDIKTDVVVTESKVIRTYL